MKLTDEVIKQAINNGKKVKRESWNEGWYLYKDNNGGIRLGYDETKRSDIPSISPFRNHGYPIWEADIISNDWEVIDE